MHLLWSFLMYVYLSTYTIRCFIYQPDLFVSFSQRLSGIPMLLEKLQIFVLRAANLAKTLSLVCVCVCVCVCVISGTRKLRSKFINEELFSHIGNLSKKKKKKKKRIRPHLCW